MKNSVNAILMVLLSTMSAAAQNPIRVYSEPAVPTQETLGPLNLKLAWRIYLPTDRRRDGIFSVQIVPQGRGEQILVQTRAGLVIALDGESGVTQWRARIGNPYTVANLLGYNSKSVFAVNGLELYSVNRATGIIQWIFTLPHAPTSAPVADDDRLYVTLTNRLHAYDLPKEVDTTPSGIEKRLEALPERAAGTTPDSVSLEQAKTASVFGARAQGIQAVSAVSSRGQAVRSVGPLASLSAGTALPPAGPQPQFLWEYLTDSPVELSPLYTASFVAMASYNGVFFVMGNEDGRHLYRLQAGPPLTAPLSQYKEIEGTGKLFAYVASEDYSVYALDVELGRVLWRFAAGGPVKRRAIPTDHDVYVSAERAGLYRVDRNTGDLLWQNSDAERFLAANKKYVYAADRSGRLLILDLARGNVLATYQATRDFVVPISNNLTDRILLASNDGLLVCLHDRDYRTPMHLAPIEEPITAPGKGQGKTPVKIEGKTPEKPAKVNEAPEK
jgi:outer membrane protein assembly factor BamB